MKNEEGIKRVAHTHAGADADVPSTSTSANKTKEEIAAEAKARTVAPGVNKFFPKAEALGMVKVCVWR